MAGPVTRGGLGVRGGGLGLMGLGASQEPQPFTFPSSPALALPFVAHLYNNGMQFKRTLGDTASVGSSGAGSAMITKPGLKMTLNGGYHPITLDLAGAQPFPNLVVDPGFEASDVLADVQANWALTTPGEWALMTTATDMRSGRRAIKCTRTNLGPNNWNSGISVAYMPVIPGSAYTASVWSKQTGGAQSSFAQINFYTAAGALISQTSFMGLQSGVKLWTFYTASLTAPANAALALLQVAAGWWDGVTGANAQTWFDDARFALGTSASDPIQLGDIIRLTEQGDNSGAILYTGIVEEMPDEVGVGTSNHHQVTLTPLVAELGDTDFNQQYSTLIDVAQMVRDAVNKTAHCRVSQASCGDTGVKAIYNFNQTNCLEVLNVAKRIAGVNFWWFVDATGLVWFQSTTPTNPARLTLKRGSDLVRRRKTPSIVGRKNMIRALGGYPTGVATPIQSVYSNAASQKAYGMRKLEPGLVFPTVTDQATLDKIVATIGAALDRVHNTIEVDAPALASRLTLATPGGLTARIQEPAQEAIPQPVAVGSGGFDGPYVCQDIEVNGIEQKLIFNDVPVSGLSDIEFEVDRIVQRTSILSAAYGT